MNNNIFLSSNKDSDLQNIDKYNPDVVRNYGIIKNLHNKSHDGKFINSYYKSVTNEPVKTNIKSVRDLQLEKDTPDLRTLNTNYDKSLQQRLTESIIVEQSIQRYKRENGIIERTHDEINKEYQLEQQRLEQLKLEQEQQRLEQQRLEEQQKLEQEQQRLEQQRLEQEQQRFEEQQKLEQEQQRLEQEQQRLEQEQQRLEQLNVPINDNFIIDDDEDKNDHITLKNQYKSYVLNDNDRLLKEKKKYNDILKDLEDIL